MAAGPVPGARDARHELHGVGGDSAGGEGVERGGSGRCGEQGVAGGREGVSRRQEVGGQLEQRDDPALRGRPVIVAPVGSDTTVAIAASSPTCDAWVTQLP